VHFSRPPANNIQTILQNEKLSAALARTPDWLTGTYTASFGVLKGLTFITLRATFAL